MCRLFILATRPGRGIVVAMFLDEGRLGAMLDHENIVSVVEVGEVASG